MDTQTRRFLANDLTPHPAILKEISTQPKRKQIHSYFDKQSTLIIDYGSQTIKAGFDQSSGPELVFRPYVSKNRDLARQQQPVKTSINTSYEQLSFVKENYKSLFERNIILHFSILEQCNDYVFSELAKPNKKIRSNLIITEPFANPAHCRENMLEQLFQCYEIENVMVGIESLFKYFYEVDCNLDRYEKETSLVIDMGANTTHVFCMNKGSVDWQSVRRINLGGNQSFDMFSKTLLLKNPQLRSRFTYAFLRDIYEKFTCVALDYKQQLRYFAKKYQPFISPVYKNRVDELNKQICEELNFIQGVQIDFDTIIEVPEEQIKRKEEIKHRMAEKLKETILRRKQMKRKMQQHELNGLMELKKKYEEHDLGAHEEAAEMFGHHKPHQKLIKKIKALQIKLGLIPEQPEEKKFSLIDIPDHELPPEKLKFKRMQIYQKKAVEQRREKQRKKEEEQQRMKQLRENNPELYLKLLKQKFKLMSQKAKEHERMKAEMANRKSQYNKKKMQVIARLAEEQFNEEEFEEEEELEKLRQQEDEERFSDLDVMEAELREIDPEYTNQKDDHHLNSTNQLFLLSELIKCHQIYFEPQLIGLNQMDVIETIVSVLSLYDQRTKRDLLKNVVIVGGASKVAGLKERFERDLRRQCPVEMQIKVKIGKGGAQGAFFAMQHIGKTQKEFIQTMSYKRSQYLESKRSKPVMHAWSNQTKIQTE